MHEQKRECGDHLRQRRMLCVEAKISGLQVGVPGGQMNEIVTGNALLRHARDRLRGERAEQKRDPERKPAPAQKARQRTTG
jgi:hypothetical protein